MDAARPGARIIGLLLGVAWSSWCTAPATPPFPGPTVQPQTRRFEDTSARRPSRRGPTPRIVARRPLRRSLSSRRGAMLGAFPSRSLRPLDPFRKIKDIPGGKLRGRTRWQGRPLNSSSCRRRPREGSGSAGSCAPSGARVGAGEGRTSRCVGWVSGRAWRGRRPSVFFVRARGLEPGTFGW